MYTLRLAEHLSAHNIESRVICADARMVEVKRREELKIAEYPHLTTPVAQRITLEILARELQKKPPDLIHIQSREMLAQGVWLARRLRCPYVLTVHDYLNPSERVRFDVRWGRKAIAVSESVRTELLSRVSLPEDKVEVIHSGVEPDKQIDTLPVLAEGHIPVIGTAGPLEAMKGLPYFLRAAQLVLESKREVEFLISGAGPEEANLRQLARDLKISEQVTFVPNLLDYAACLAAMDIFCLPSLKQGLGTIMLEAMTLGKPVIATGVGGVYSVIRDNETGLVIPPSDSETLAECVMKLLDDVDWARSIGHAGREMVKQNFNVETMVRLTVDLYRQIAEENEVRPKPEAESASVA